jgi:hypothetical protein
MKYCKKCKIAAKETDTVCPKCMGALSSFGSANTGAGAAKPAPAARPQPNPPARPQPNPPVSSPPPSGHRPPPTTGRNSNPKPAPAASKVAFTLSGKIAELEQVKEKNLKRGRNLGLLSLLAALAIFIVLYTLYSRTENQITVSFDVKTPGKVAFDRRSGTGHTEKLDQIAAVEHQRTVWSWPSDPKTGIDFSVVSRGGWFRTRTDRHFKVTRKDVGVEVVFLMDVTSSMQPYIDGLKEKCIAFADEIRRDGIDCRLGLIGFGDVNYNEPITVFDPNADPKEFQDAVASLQLTNGGDPPESSVEAIEKAMEMEFRPHTRICFVHITDAGCHHSERIPELAASLKENKVVTYVISQRNLRQLYSRLCVNGGSFYGIKDAPFESILKEVAKSISNQIKSD